MADYNQNNRSNYGSNESNYYGSGYDETGYTGYGYDDEDNGYQMDTK